MSGFENDVMYAKNADFTQVDNQNASEANGLFTNGQIWIGSTATNAGGTHVNVGTLTSPDSSIIFGYSSPNITGQVAGGTSVGKTITGNTGGALSPTAGNWNILGPNSALTGFSPWSTGSGSTLTVNMPGTVKWVVNPTANLGTHTTIQAAITSASAGDTVFITDGTYTENLTLKVGVNITASMNSGQTPNVTIIGNSTLSTAGSVTISNIRLQTNGAAIITVSGSAASILNVVDCYLNCTNSTGISFTAANTSAAIRLYSCFGDLGTTGIALYTMTSTGNLFINYSSFSNTGLSTTSSNTSAGTVFLGYVGLISPTSSSGTGGISYVFCTLNLTIINTTAITQNGTGSGQLYNCSVFSGTASAISIGSGASLAVSNCQVNSSNTNAITGAGSITIAGISFPGTSSLINTTTQVLGAFNGGQYIGRTSSSIPSVGMIGEFNSGGGNAVAVLNNTGKTIGSMTLTPGTWNISGFAFILNTGTITSQSLGISTTNNTMPAGTAGVNFAQVIPYGGTAATAGNTLTIPTLTQYVATNTTYYLVALCLFTAGACAVNGFITANRIA